MNKLMQSMLMVERTKLDSNRGTNAFKGRALYFGRTPTQVTNLTLQNGNAAISESILEFTDKYNINDELKAIDCDSSNALDLVSQDLI